MEGQVAGDRATPSLSEAPVPGSVLGSQGAWLSSVCFMSVSKKQLPFLSVSSKQGFKPIF